MPFLCPFCAFLPPCIAQKVYFMPFLPLISLILSVFMPFCVIFVHHGPEKQTGNACTMPRPPNTHNSAHPCHVVWFSCVLYPLSPCKLRRKVSFWPPFRSVQRIPAHFGAVRCFCGRPAPQKRRAIPPSAQHTLAAHICACRVFFPCFLCPLSVKTPWKSPFFMLSVFLVCGQFLGQPSAHTYVVIANGHVCFEVTAAYRQTEVWKSVIFVTSPLVFP